MNSSLCYGSFLEPVDLGSGSQPDCSSGTTGGGAMRLTIAGPLVVDGAIRSDGGTQGALCGTSGSSGGSLWIECAALSGNGTIAADGGASNRNDAGGGGGGRVAVYFTDRTAFTGSIRALGGASPGGVLRAGAGTVWLKPANDDGMLVIDGGGLADANTTDFSGLTVIPGDLVVRGLATVAHAEAETGLHILVERNATIEADGAISTRGRGFPFGQGPGSGGLGGGGRPGASHGGVGGNGAVIAALPAYGSAIFPTDLGSGAWPDCGLGAPGGGAVRLSVGSTLAVFGLLGSDAATGGACGSGGAAGGSVLVRAGVIAGSGIIAARGGAPNRGDSSGGGGGRIALYSCSLALPAENILVTGGTGARSGAAGTITTGSGSIAVSSPPTPQTSYFGGDTVELSVTASTSQNPPTLNYRWRRNGVELSDGDLDGRVSGATTATLLVSSIRCADGGVFDVLLTDACGTFPSDPAAVRVRSRADFNGDFALDGDDLADYINCYFSVPPCEDAEFNDDGAVNADDLGDFINVFFEGC